jgi:hypothetical protein
MVQTNLQPPLLVELQAVVRVKTVARLAARAQAEAGRKYQAEA